MIKYKLKVWVEILFSPAEFSRSEANDCDDVSIRSLPENLSGSSYELVFSFLFNAHGTRGSFPIRK